MNPNDITLLIPDGININARPLIKYCLPIEPYVVKKVLPNEVAQEYDLCIVLDTASREQLKTLSSIVLDYCKRIAILDHHAEGNLLENIPRSKPLIYYISTDASSTSEIVARLASIYGLKLCKEVCECILAGILFDTRRFLRGSKETFEIVSVLLSMGADYSKALSFTKESVESLAKRLAKIKCILRHRGFRLRVRNRDILLSTSHIGAYESDCANILISLGYDVAFVATDDETLNAVRIAFRSREAVPHDIVETILSNLVSKYGGSFGGHRTAGMAVLRIRDPEKAVNLLVDVLRETFSEVYEFVER